jgi:UDP-3-O-[3-hydroxymyristoyl] glucosamine N-acyltransferase
MMQKSPIVHCGPTTALACTRAVGDTAAEGSIGIPLYHTDAKGEGILRVRELAVLLSAEFEGNGEIEISGAAPVDLAGPTDLSFASGPALAKAGLSRAGCLIVPQTFENRPARTVIRSEQPRNAFAVALARLYPPEPIHPSVHRTAVIDSSAFVDATCEVGAHVTVGKRARIGEGVRIESGCTIGHDVVIGAHTTLHPNVTIYPRVRIGERVILHAGAVIGADGFGFVLSGDHYQKFPQVGIVTIHDDVEIGANSCVDRAALGATEIGAGTKLDNMVHIGHNCSIGRHVVIAAQTGLSGGVVVEDYAVIGGQVGIGDKARIQSRAVLGSGSGVLTSKIVRAGDPVWGTPARPLRQHLENLANISRLPRLREEVAALKQRIEELERKD